MRVSEKIKNHKWLILSLILLMGIFALFGHYKEYLYEDEVLSYTAANSGDGMRPAVPLNSFVNGEDFVLDAVAVQPEGRFDFSNAIGNTSRDPHPPLYLLLLHFISSLFPGMFSKWFALIINLISGAGVVVLLYFTALKMYPGDKMQDGPEKTERVFAGAVAICFILSMGAVGQFMNLRMYVLLTFFTTALNYLYILILSRDREREFFDIKSVLIILITVVPGILTHYYFLIFAFYEAAFISIYFLCRKNIKAFILHGFIYIVSFVLVFLLFPACIWQLTGSDVGSESFGTRTLPEIIRRFRVMFSHINNELFGGELKLFLLFLAAGLIWITAAGIRKTEDPDGTSVVGNYGNGRQNGVLKRIFHIFMEYTGIKYFFLLSVGILYFLTVSCTTPYLTGRYLFPAYPLYILIAAWAFFPVLKALFKSPAAGLVIFMLVMVMPLYGKIKSGLFDVNKAAMQSISKEHSGDICVFFRGITTEENYFELKNFGRLMSMRLNPEEGEDPGDTVKIKGENEIVIYVPDGKDPEQYFQRIRDINPELTAAERLYKAYYSDAYIIKKD